MGAQGVLMIFEKKREKYPPFGALLPGGTPVGTVAEAERMPERMRVTQMERMIWGGFILYRDE